MLARRDLFSAALLGPMATVRFPQNVAPGDDELALVNGRIYTFGFRSVPGQSKEFQTDAMHRTEALSLSW